MTEERKGLPRWAYLTLVAAVIVAALGVLMLTVSGHQVPQDDPTAPTTSAPAGHRPGPRPH